MARRVKMPNRLLQWTRRLRLCRVWFPYVGAPLTSGVISEHSATSGFEVSTGGRALQVLALVLFFGLGSLVSLPCLCTGGSIRGFFTMTALLLAISRLAWRVYRRTFQYRDYVVYLAIVIAFGLWADIKQEQ